MGKNKTMPLIEKKRIVDEVTKLKKTMKIPKACEELGITVSDFWNYKKTLKRANFDGAPESKGKECKTAPGHVEKGSPLFKLFLQDATLALTSGTFEVIEGGIAFNGSGIIKVDSK